MKNKNIIILSVLLLTVFLFIINQKEKDKIHNIQTNIEYNDQDTIGFYKQYFYLNDKYTGIEIPAITSEEYHIAKLSKKKLLLIFRYSHLDCSTCVEKNIDMIKHFFSPEDSCVYIFSSYYSKKDMYAFKKLNKISFPIINIELEEEKFPIEKCSAPYFFILHPSLKISNIFIPSEHSSLLTENYLRNMNRLLLEKK